MGDTRVLASHSSLEHFLEGERKWLDPHRRSQNQTPSLAHLRFIQCMTYSFCVGDLAKQCYIPLAAVIQFNSVQFIFIERTVTEQ
ncbi:protein transport protein Sec24D-like [Arapaima gigas]